MEVLFPLALAIPFLIVAALAFLIVVGLVNLVHRLATGRYFRWFGRPVRIVFALYLAAWTIFLYAAFSSPNAFLITH
jgi:hypothetical protein